MPFQLPLLSLDVGTKAAKESVTRRWLEAVGERPTFPLWKRVGRRKHMWLHDLARNSRRSKRLRHWLHSWFYPYPRNARRAHELAEAMSRSNAVFIIRRII